MRLRWVTRWWGGLQPDLANAADPRLAASAAPMATDARKREFILNALILYLINLEDSASSGRERVLIVQGPVGEQHIDMRPPYEAEDRLLRTFRDLGLNHGDRQAPRLGYARRLEGGVLRRNVGIEA